MEIDIRLKALLREYGLNRRGITKEIAGDLNVHRHTIGKLYRNEVTQPGLPLLGRICDWLVEHDVPAEVLPQALFGVHPAKLFDALTATGSVRIFMGEYVEIHSDQPFARWLSRHDATVSAELVLLLTGLNARGEHNASVHEDYVPFRFRALNARIDRRLFGEDVTDSTGLYRSLMSGDHNSAVILIGSQRINHLVEHLVADLFGCAPFKGGDETRTPFYLLFRDRDRQVPSCFGDGSVAPKGWKGEAAPGIYYLDDRQKWAHCPCKPQEEDAGIVLSVYDPGNKRAILAVFGFSGTATEAIGRELVTHPDLFWRQNATTRGRKVGVCVCRFGIGSRTRKGLRTGKETYAKAPEIVQLSSETLKQFLH